MYFQPVHFPLKWLYSSKVIISARELISPGAIRQILTVSSVWASGSSRVGSGGSPGHQFISQYSPPRLQRQPPGLWEAGEEEISETTVPRPGGLRRQEPTVPDGARGAPPVCSVPHKSRGSLLLPRVSSTAPKTRDMNSQGQELFFPRWQLGEARADDRKDLLSLTAALGRLLPDTKHTPARTRSWSRSSRDSSFLTSPSWEWILGKDQQSCWFTCWSVPAQTLKFRSPDHTESILGTLDLPVLSQTLHLKPSPAEFNSESGHRSCGALTLHGQLCR